MNSGYQPNPGPRSQPPGPDTPKAPPINPNALESSPSIPEPNRPAFARYYFDVQVVGSNAVECINLLSQAMDVYLLSVHQRRAVVNWFIGTYGGEK